MFSVILEPCSNSQPRTSSCCYQRSRSVCAHTAPHFQASFREKVHVSFCLLGCEDGALARLDASEKPTAIRSRMMAVTAMRDLESQDTAFSSECVFI